MSSRWTARRLAAALCALAGGMDTVTGVLLVTAPLFTLHLMGIDSPPSGAVSVRFIGAFVAGVGLCYGLPFVGGGAAAWPHRLVAVFDATAVVRLSVATFLFAATARGVLGAAWLTVAVTDFLLALLQLGLRGPLLHPGERR